MEFFYLQTTKRPTTDFKAIKVNNTLYPAKLNNSGKYESFIFGIGWKQRKNVYNIPYFKNPSIKGLNNYLKEYGKYCLYFALTGRNLNNKDIVYESERNEFNVACEIGFDKINEIASKVNELNCKIFDIVYKKHGVSIYHDMVQTTKQGNIVFRDLFQAKIEYSIMGLILTPKPNLNPVVDDQKLWKHFKALYPEIPENKFPVSVKERLEYLFSKEVSELYEDILKNSYNEITEF